MARYDLRASIISLGAVATSLAAARTSAAATLSAVLPPEWTVEEVNGRDASPLLGEWVVARKGSGSTEFAHVVGAENGQGPPQVLFSDGSRRGLAAVLSRVE